MGVPRPKREWRARKKYLCFQGKNVAQKCVVYIIGFLINTLIRLREQAKYNILYFFQKVFLKLSADMKRKMKYVNTF
jgi:hypothetical protein